MNNCFINSDEKTLAYNRRLNQALIETMKHGNRLKEVKEGYAKDMNYMYKKWIKKYNKKIADELFYIFDLINLHTNIRS